MHTDTLSKIEGIIGLNTMIYTISDFKLIFMNSVFNGCLIESYIIYIFLSKLI